MWPLDQLGRDMWTELLAWHFGPICNFERKWDCFAIKQELDCFEN